MARDDANVAPTKDGRGEGLEEIEGGGGWWVVVVVAVVVCDRCSLWKKSRNICGVRSSSHCLWEYHNQEDKGER
jgi:hypothetical protein